MGTNMAKTESVPAALWEKDVPRGPALMRVNIKVLAEDNETLLRTETCDVFLESTLSYNEEQLTGLGGTEGAAKSFAEQVLTSLLPPSEEGPLVTLYKALQRKTSYPPKEGTVTSLEEDRNNDLCSNPLRRSQKSTEPGQLPKFSIPVSNPAPTPSDK
jgi:hypothetical protein